MVQKVELSASVRSNLLSLQSTVQLIGRTQRALSTGLKVADAIDNPSSYFQAKGLSDRATDFTTVKEGINQSISTLKVAIKGLEGITSIMEQMKGLAQKAYASTIAERSVLAVQFNALRTQLDSLAGDSSYQGENLINGSTNILKINFNENSTIELNITAIDNTVTGLAVNAASNNWGLDSDIDTAFTAVNTALVQLRANASALASNVSLLQIRLDFSKELVNALEEGSGKLIQADVNEEGANLLTLQTRQQLGVNALSLATQSEQSVLRLFQ